MTLKGTLHVRAHNLTVDSGVGFNVRFFHLVCLFRASAFREALENPWATLKPQTATAEGRGRANVSKAAAQRLLHQPLLLALKAPRPRWSTRTWFSYQYTETHKSYIDYVSHVSHVSCGQAVVLEATLEA